MDSPVANVANIARALRTAGATLDITSDAAAIARGAQLVLPGVGSFAAAMQWLVDTRIDIAIRKAVANGASLLGICVGHQLLFESSDEMGTTRGLGLVSGAVRRLEGPLPVPQIGWNRVRVGAAALGRPGAAGPTLFDGVENEAFYFVHSYAARDAESEIASSDYNGPFTAAIRQGRVFGVQFHPEKSSHAGLRVLRNFIACS
ncbi:MAG TPA: imidazole glycerol phosphate synthase subunit HisH [Thermoanaerobaculia bacterium]|nr:imidazole glycerol phosphate synthase subunit HisH [Thermoanaerobaculia bacterium]